MMASSVGRPEGVSPVVPRESLTSTDGLLRPLLQAAMERGTEARFEVEGGSMLPLIRSHDVVHVRPVAGVVIGVGDVVAMRGPQETGLLVHRAVGRQGDRLVLRGDNCTQEDGCFGREDTIGVVARVERDGREVWFGAGRWGWLVAWAVRTGLVWRVNRIYYAPRRRARSCLKFLGRVTRLREHKGDDGNE